MSQSVELTEYLTGLATGGSVLPRNECVGCGKQLFRGYALFVEQKCRFCQGITVFEYGKEPLFYRVKPY